MEAEETFRGLVSSLIIVNSVLREFPDGSDRIHLCTVLGLRLPRNTGQPWDSWRLQEAEGSCKDLAP